jgi:hypothetical protein
MATRIAGRSGFRRPPSELSDDTNPPPPAAKFTTPEPSPAAESPSAEPQAVDATNDAAHVDKPPRIPLDTRGDATAMVICRMMMSKGFCVAQGTASIGQACKKIVFFDGPVKGNPEAIDSGYNRSPTIDIFRNFGEYFDIKAYCDASNFERVYYYTFTLKEGFEVSEADDNFFVQETAENETHAAAS